MTLLLLRLSAGGVKSQIAGVAEKAVSTFKHPEL
jgi:hypothetical protein